MNQPPSGASLGSNPTDDGDGATTTNPGSSQQQQQQQQQEQQEQQQQQQAQQQQQYFQSISGSANPSAASLPAYNPFMRSMPNPWLPFFPPPPPPVAPMMFGMNHISPEAFAAGMADVVAAAGIGTIGTGGATGSNDSHQQQQPQGSTGPASETAAGHSLVPQTQYEKFIASSAARAAAARRSLGVQPPPPPLPNNNSAAAAAAAGPSVEDSSINGSKKSSGKRKLGVRLQDDISSSSSSSETGDDNNMLLIDDDDDKEEIYQSIKKKKKNKKKEEPIEREEQLNLLFDWNGPASRGLWGRDSLVRRISVPEFDCLVGWATHVERPAARRRAETATDGGGFDPLAGLPSDSLPPSILDSLYNVGLKNTAQQDADDEDDESQEADGSSRRKRSRSVIWESFDSSAMVALGMVLEEMITMSILPLARRYTDRCIQRGSLSKDKNDDGDDDDNDGSKKPVVPSPEAEREASELDNAAKNEDKEDDAKNESPPDEERDHLTPAEREEIFDEWTLPPEEALLKLVRDETQHKPQTRSGSVLVAGITNPKIRIDDNSISQSSPSSTMVHDFSNWCQDHDVNEQFVRDNMDLFDLFFPSCLRPNQQQNNNEKDVANDGSSSASSSSSQGNSLSI